MTQPRPINSSSNDQGLATRTYRVQFVEWVLYEGFVEADNPDAAIKLIQERVAENGIEHLRVRDNGMENFTADRI